MIRIDVFSPGTKIGIGPDGKIEAMILQTCVEVGHKVTYQVAWWDGLTRKCEWLRSCELTPLSEAWDRTRIGFVTQKSNGSNSEGC